MFMTIKKEEMMNETIIQSITNLPQVEGPIPVTDHSHPFCAAAYAREPLHLEEYGYVEEEYFLSGTANVYEGYDQLAVKYEKMPYKTRILVRKPAPEQFSGRVFVDIYNASNGYDIEDVWRRSYQYYLEQGHIYIGITSKPINVLSLKNFDYDRYQTLNWTGAEIAPQPATIDPGMSIPGTEEGLIWDMISQLGSLIHSGEAPFLKDYPVANIYLTGQSQSGIYLNTYVYFFHDYVTDLFDGYLNVVGAGIMRDLNQYEKIGTQFSARKQLLPKNLDTPFILLSSQGDIELFTTFGERSEVLEKMNQVDTKIRHYELTSSPHTDPASALIQDNAEIVKTKNLPKLLDGDYEYEVNSIQLAYYVNSALEFLHHWAVDGIEPPHNLTIARDENGIPLMDEHGNGVGGLRSPYIDVPIATYHPNALADPSQINQAVGNVNGSMSYFDSGKLQSLYVDAQDYLNQFADKVNEQVKAGWLLEADAKRMMAWAEEQAKQLFQ